ncbi:MAG: hypothetical protein RL215_161, partial [Planctomycetota bacterium]
MSTVIRNCPGCKSLILSDTDQCPECGHVFYHRRSTSAAVVVDTPAPTSSRSSDLRESCPHCGEMVRTGLVRCWSCNGFMRADIAQRYRDLTTNPQPIIYSTIPPEQRSDFLPPRAAIPGGSEGEADEFTLSDDVLAAAPNASFPVQPAAPAVTAKSTADSPDKPQSTTPA